MAYQKSPKPTSTSKVKARKRSKKKGSGRPYTKHSTMTCFNTVASAAGVQVFSKVASGIGNQAAEGDMYRRITNTHATLVVQIGETQAQAIGATGFRIMPLQTVPLLGVEGVGWAGDLWIFEATGVAVVSGLAF